ncbi:MAG: hypothetical protein ACM3PU_10580 [Gemmatimonadota bacterium]
MKAESDTRLITNLKSQLATSSRARTQLKQLFDAIRELMVPPAPAKRPIGFIELEDKGKK